MFVTKSEPMAETKTGIPSITYCTHTQRALIVVCGHLEEAPKHAKYPCEHGRDHGEQNPIRYNAPIFSCFNTMLTLNTTIICL